MHGSLQFWHFPVYGEDAYVLEERHGGLVGTKAYTEIEGLMSSGSVTHVTGTLFRMSNTLCWTVRMNILLAFAHSTASWSSHLSMRIAQLV